MSSETVPPESTNAPNDARTKRTVICVLVLLLATLLVYQPVMHNGFVNYDDRDYFGDPHIRGGLSVETVKWAFTTFHAANWHPLTWLSHALDVDVFGANPAGHHYATVLLHGACAVLLFLLLESATGLAWPSLAVAALFALHPINVESVAWASERKNVLSMLFFLLGLFWYQRYARRPSLGRYGAVVAFFVCGLMSKPQVITFPFVLLLWDYWPLDRLKASTAGRLVLEKLPLFGLAAASAAITIKAQAAGGALTNAGGALQSAIPYSFGSRLGNAIVSYARYVGKAIWPSRLAVLYPHNPIPPWQVALAGVVLVGITVLVVAQRKHKYLPVGWAWFLGTLVPMIGIMQVGAQSMADRYAYLPLIGLFMMVAFATEEATRGRAVALQCSSVAAIAALCAFGAFTVRQIHFWQNSEFLWRHTLAVTDKNFIAHDQLGSYLMGRGRATEAVAESRKAVEIYPDDPPANLNIGIFYHAAGALPQARVQYEKVLRVSHNADLRSDAYANLASVCRDLHDYGCARASDEEALQLTPDKPIALIGLGLLAHHDGDFETATKHYSRALAVQPTDVGFVLLSRALEQAGHHAESGAAYERARQLAPNIAEAEKTATALLNF